jgi:8-oxo-dGTP diphosphatase
VNDPSASFATPRIASGALFVRADQLLLVRKTYGDRWDIPGGYVDRGESPSSACQREVLEELDIERQPVRLLVHDWAPHESEGDKILYVFDCGDLGHDEARIKLDGSEVDRWEWASVGSLDDYVIPRLSRRLTRAYEAYRTGATLYLEHGRPLHYDSVCDGLSS